VFSDVRRLIAVIVAVALVVIALVIRNGSDDGGDGASGKLKLVCAPELESACNALGSDVDVTVQTPGTLADKLEKASGDPGIDGWLTPGPWPEMVEAARKGAGVQPLFAVEHPPARTRIGLAVWPDRLSVLNGACTVFTWKCFGDVVGKGTWTTVGGPAAWGQIKIGFPDPPNDATGLAALGAATVGYFGTTNFSSTDLDDPGFRSWLRNLVKANADNPNLDDVLARGPAEAAAAATLEAVGGPVLASSPRSPKPALTYPAPVASADVVLGSVISDRGRRLASIVNGQLPELLRNAGWQVGGATPTGLPAADLLDALRQAWREAQ
jgi:hypothetical protein